MSDIVLRVENLNKQYRLGLVGTGSLKDDLQRTWARLRGKEDPLSKVGETNQLENAGGDYVWALKDINFEVSRGEVLGIIGRNGAGKSTLLKLLSKVTGPTKGNIYVNGRIASLLEVGTGFHPELTGRENIFLNGAILGMRKQEIRGKLDEIVDFAGVDKYLDTPVKRYSSGMYVRLAFAVAAHLEPEILIVDEVLAVGDIEFQKKAIGKMQDVSKGQGRTVLFVSHNMVAIKKLCHRAILLRNGCVHLEGDVNAAVTEYVENYFAKKFDFTAHYRSNLGGVEVVDILDKTGMITSKINVGDNFSIKIIFRIENEMPHFILAVGLSCAEIPIRTAYTNVHDLKPGTYSIIFYFDDIIYSLGKYSLNIGLSNYERVIQYLENCSFFEVALGMTDIPDQIRRTSDTGLILNPLKYELEER